MKGGDRNFPITMKREIGNGELIWWPYLTAKYELDIDATLWYGNLHHMIS
jgi:hypothetical protein